MGTLTNADEPAWEIEIILEAPYANFAIVPVNSEQFPEFLNAAFQAGPYVGRSQFANERIVEPMGVDGAGNAVIFTRHFDQYSLDRASDRRAPAMEEYAAGETAQIAATLVLSTFGNWSWEIGQNSKPRQGSYTLNNMSEVVWDQTELSVSFGKNGYVGQTAAIEFFDASTPLSVVKDQISKRSAIQGASIYKATDAPLYIVYSEYFKSPTDLAEAQLSISAGGNGPVMVRGAQMGVVAANYGRR